MLSLRCCNWIRSPTNGEWCPPTGLLFVSAVGAVADFDPQRDQKPTAQDALGMARLAIEVEYPIKGGLGLGMGLELGLGLGLWTYGLWTRQAIPGVFF